MRKSIPQSTKLKMFFIYAIIIYYQIFQNKSYLMDSQSKEIKWNDHIKLGPVELNSRVVMTSLTRTRCDPQTGVPYDLHVQYYTQRAGAAMILTEASAWSLRGHAYPGAGNFYTKQQIEGWRKVVDAVHQKNGKIYLQLLHCGRQTHQMLNGGQQVWAPSPIPVRSNLPFSQNIPYPVPKQMTINDIKETQQQYRKAVKNAKDIGFDGIQIHGAHGYIVDQFLRSQTNKRTDIYGGSAQNRARFCLQLIDISLWYQSIPVSQYGDMYDQNPVQTFSYLLQELSKRNIGFVEIRQSSQYEENKKGSGSKTYYQKTPPQQIQLVCKTLRPFFNGVLIGNDSMTSQRGLEFIRQGWADMISFGRLYISNPDLAQRLINNQQLNRKWDYTTFYSPLNPKGYTDYPFYKQQKCQSK